MHVLYTLAPSRVPGTTRPRTAASQQFAHLRQSLSSSPQEPPRTLGSHRRSGPGPQTHGCPPQQTDCFGAHLSISPSRPGGRGGDCTLVPARKGRASRGQKPGRGQGSETPSSPGRPGVAGGDAGSATSRIPFPAAPAPGCAPHLSAPRGAARRQQLRSAPAARAALTHRGVFPSAAGPDAFAPLRVAREEAGESSGLEGRRLRSPRDGLLGQRWRFPASKRASELQAPAAAAAAPK